MGNLSRFDLLRIVFPGAVATILATVALRLVALVPDATPILARHRELLVDGYTFLEDPFRGLAVAFALGYVLYFLDPGYQAGSYRRDLPSDHLSKVLEECGYPRADRRDVYFLLLNEHMPADLRERSLLYGAFFRIGFLSIMLTQLTSVLIVIGLLYVTTAAATEASLAAIFSPTAMGLTWSSIGVLLGGGWVFRRKRTKRDRRVRSEGAFLDSGNGIALLIILVGAATLAIGMTHPELGLSDGRLVVTVGLAVATSLWLGARLAGPLWEWAKAMVRGDPYYKPREDFSSDTELLLDYCLTVLVLASLTLMSNALGTVQLMLAAGLPLVALSLAFVRKHERQQHGIYRNQNAWIEEHLNLAVTLLPETRRSGAVEGPSASSINGVSGGGHARPFRNALAVIGLAALIRLAARWRRRFEEWEG